MSLMKRILEEKIFGDKKGNEVNVEKKYKRFLTKKPKNPIVQKEFKWDTGK